MKCSKITKAQHILIFSKWGRKNFSLFATLNKTVKIAVLSVVYFLSAPVLLVAQTRDTSEVKMEYDLDEIEVSAKRTPALYSQVARVISVIEQAEIELSPAENVQDLLEYIAGVDVRQRGAEGIQADVSIRGGTFDQTLILLNGINITDPQTGHHNLNLPVSLEQVQRIEVLEGPAARVYGPNAFSGAINIVTKPPGTKELNIKLSGGSFSYFNANISSGFQTGKLQHLLAARRKSSKGYIGNTDFGIVNIFYSNRFETDWGVLSFQSGFSEKAFGANSFYTPRFPEQFERTKTYFSSLKWESFSKLHLTPVIYWRRHNDRFELFRNESPEWYTSHNYHKTDVLGTGINFWIQWQLGKTAFGAEFRNEQILSNVLGADLVAPIKVPGENAFYSKSATRSTTSVFFEHAYYRNNWTVTAGFMGNYISESGLGINIFPGAEISYNFSSSAKLFASYNTSLRMPTFTDLYYEGPTNIGNPNLKPEKSSSIEGGIKLYGEILQGHWVVFYRNGRNIIDWVKMDSDQVWQPRNLTGVKSFGSEFQLQVALKKYLEINVPERVSISYFNNNLKKQTSNFISNYVLDNLKHKLTLAVDQELFSDFSLGIKSIFQDREGTFTFYENNSWAEEVAYEPFWLFDVKLKYEYKNLGTFVSVKNVFNTKYYDIGNVIQPGRWLKAGLTYRFKFE